MCCGFVSYFLKHFEKDFSSQLSENIGDLCRMRNTLRELFHHNYLDVFPTTLYKLSLQGLLLYQKTTRNSYLESDDGPAQPSSNMDRFERCFSIFKLDTREGRRATEASEESDGEAPDARESNPASGSRAVNQGAKPWRAVRVDLVVSPISQFAFALLGWTGSKVSLDFIVNKTTDLFN